jgi:hypothetical protein
MEINNSFMFAPRKRVKLLASGASINPARGLPHGG